MATQWKQYSAEFKARVAMEVLKGYKTMNELVSLYGVHPTQIAKWRHHLHSELPQIFSNRREQGQQDQEALTDQLYQQIGQLKVELDWLKKIWTCRLMSNGSSSSRIIPRSACLGSATFWVCLDPPTIIRHKERVQRICS
jgi:transposase-like protein